MKTFKSFHNSITALSVVAVASAMTFSSCQQEELSNPTSSNSTADKVVTCGNDSTIVADFKFNYGDMGPTSASSYVEDIDFGPSSTGVTSRAGGPTTASVVTGILNFVGTTVLNTTGARTTNMIIDAILNNNSGEMEQLKQMDAKIDQIQKLIINLQQKADDKDVRDAYNERMDKFNQLEFTNCSYFVSFCNAIKSGNIDVAKQKADKWAKEPAVGTTAPGGTYDYIQMLNGMTTASQLTLTEVYDYWVFRTTPWEHEGYQKREQLRAADVCVATSGYLMAVTFYLMHPEDENISMLERLNRAFKLFIENYSKNTVEHHDDLRICQIQGASCVMDKNIVMRDMKNHPWSPENIWFGGERFRDFMYGDSKHDGDYGLRHSLTHDEVEAIYNYYNCDRANKMTMEQIMKQADFNMDGLTEGKTHVMTLYTGASKYPESAFNNNWIMKYNEVINICDANHPYWKDFILGSMWIDKNITLLGATNYYLKHWDNYKSDDKDFFRVDVDHRFDGTKAFKKLK